ncbi:MAG TPA: nucleotidyltransferase family protein [Terriglobia bacterium]|nr:nucleotidyltransferase family protein [Terriglobia bacterium]
MATITVPKERIAEFCRRNQIRKLALFGSVLRSDFRPDSDVDVLVEFQPGKSVGFFELYDLEEELSRAFGGRRVDLNTPQGLSKYFRDEVLNEAEVEYVEA